MHTAEDTLVFLDEIQTYPHFLTLLKFLNLDHQYTSIASGSLLGVTLQQTSSIPMGSIETLEMFPLDFEEFLMANSSGAYALQEMQRCFLNLKPRPEGLHTQMIDLLKKYFLVGGLPAVVSSYL